MLIEAQFTTVDLWKQLRCPTADKWIKKIWYKYTMEYYLLPKRMKLCYLQVNGWN
jgi:hypothetical protein